MKYIDAHCHIITDTDIARANAAGVDGFIVNATRMDDWGNVVNISGRHRDVHAAIGIHPWYVGDAPDGWDSCLHRILLDHPDMMVGETGLDKNQPDIERQEDFFRTHLTIAADMWRVVHVHCVNAWGRMLDVLRNGPRVPGIVFHSFSGPLEIMPELVRYNAYFSFGYGVLDLQHAKMCRAATRADMSRILVESDAPDSGCMPDRLGDIVAQIAALRGGSETEIAAAVHNNTIRVIKNG